MMVLMMQENLLIHENPMARRLPRQLLAADYPAGASALVGSLAASCSLAGWLAGCWLAIWLAGFPTGLPGWLLAADQLAGWWLAGALDAGRLVAG